METRIINYLLILTITFSIFIEALSANINADTTKLNYTIPASPSAICGEDNRVPSYEKAVGRIVGYYSNNLSSPISIATGFIVPNGRIVSAAHVFANMEPLDDKTIIIEFEVKPSDISGNIVPSEAQHRYIIDKSSINRGGNWDGLDWAVFDVYPNSVTGLYPIDPNAQAAFLPISIDVVTQFDVNMKVIGYGYDSRNFINNHTQQSATGLGKGFNPPDETNPNDKNPFPYLEYEIDTQPGCSGGPVIKDGKVIGVHRRSYAPNLCPNYGTQTAQSDFVYYLTTPSTYKYVTVQQNLENSANKAGYIGRWWNGSFLTFQNYSAFRFKKGSEQILHGDTTVISNQKYHKWSTDWDVKNHKYFIITENTDFLTSEFKTLATSSLIKYNCYEGVNIDTGNFYFKDPWYVKQASTYFDPPIGYRNLGNSAIEESVPNPFNPNYNSTGINILFKGVFLNQGITPQGQWQPPYYSVKAESVLDTSLTNTGSPAGRSHRFYFRNWSADSINGQPSAQFQYPNSLTTPVVFKSENATVQANLKGTQLSNNVNAYNNNSQRKSVRTPNGQLANIYESLGTIWLENSTNNGESWFILNNANPLETEPSVNPAIDYFPWSGTHSSIAAVYYPHSILKMKVMKTSGTIDYNAFLPWDPGEGYPVVPTVAVSSDRILVVSTGGINGQNGLVYFYGTVQQSPFNITWTQYNLILPGTGQYSSNPTITANKSAGNIFHIAWQEGSSIKYCTATDSGNNLTFEPVETPSTLSGYQKHLNPSISLVNGYPILSWTGVQYAGLEKVLIKDNDGTTGYQRALIRRKGPQGWGDTQVVGGNQVNFTNNNSVTAAQDKTVIVWSEGITNPQSKWIKRTGSVYSIPANLSHSGIQTQVINGSDYQFMTSIVFNNNQQPYYFIKTATDFNEERSGGGELGKVQIESDSAVTFGRAGIVSINGVEFIFNTGDVVVDNSIIGFIEKPDTIEYHSYSDLNQYTRTENFQLNGSSQFYFSNLYYVLNKELADTSLDETQSVNFKVELVNANTNQSAGTFDNITYNKYNLEKYDNISYQVNCSGIEPGDYYLRLITTVNTEAEYSLSNLMNSSEELEKRHYTEVNYAGNQIPDSYDLAQNYPNPFNPSTTIRYQLPQDGMVTLKVYDILGSEVATLVNEQKPAGRYEINFDASRLASGVYIYKLTSGNFVQTKKMLLVK